MTRKDRNTVRALGHALGNPAKQALRHKPARWKALVGSVILTAATATIFGLGCIWFTGVFAGWLGRTGWGITLLGCLVWYALLAVLIWLPMHVKRYKHMQDSPHAHTQEQGSRMGPWYDSLMEALDAIADGNFNVLVQPSNYRHSYFDDIADKVNEMARELADMENVRQDFVANVSHEIQSPLTSIEGFATLLEEGGLEEEKRRHYLEVIKAEAGRLSKLSDNLLKLSMLDVSCELDKQAYRLDKQLRDVMLLLEPQWSTAKIEVSLDAGEAMLVAEMDMLEQVWINLLHNAIKFTPEGGQIDVSVANEADCLAVTVRDTGCGMPEDVRVHIFERFYKGDKARERARGGNGLGLSIAHKIVAMHGGTMAVDSEEGVGSAFTVRLPRQ